MIRDVLFVTLDSCRYDAFAQARVPNMRALGPLVRAWSPSHFTFGSHAAFFMGFTPGNATRAEPYVNPKFAKIFRMSGGGHPGQQQAYFDLDGRSIIDGFNRRGYATIGTGAVGWCDPASATGRVLAADFGRFHYPGRQAALREQGPWLLDATREARASGRPIFAFLNLGETHVPYWHAGAPWGPSHSSVTFGGCQ